MTSRGSFKGLVRARERETNLGEETAPCIPRTMALSGTSSLAKASSRLEWVSPSSPLEVDLS